MSLRFLPTIWETKNPCQLDFIVVRPSPVKPATLHIQNKKYKLDQLENWKTHNFWKKNVKILSINIFTISWWIS